MLVDPKRAKRQSRLECLFAHLGSARLKASNKMLVKSTPVEERQGLKTGRYKLLLFSVSIFVFLVICKIYFRVFLPQILNTLT